LKREPATGPPLKEMVAVGAVNVPVIVCAVALYVADAVALIAGTEPKSFAFEDVKDPLLDVPVP